MVQVLRFNEYFANPEEALFQLRVVNMARKVLELDGKVRILHLAGKRIFETALKGSRAVDVQLSPRNESGSKERKPLNVIPVGVTDQKMNTMRTWTAQHVQAEHSNARATIKDQSRAVPGMQFHT